MRSRQELAFAQVRPTKHTARGDWNWNNAQKGGTSSSRPPALGFRRVSIDERGEPKRSLEKPVAWPSYPGYPPDRDAATGTRIDYGVSRYGGSLRETRGMHPDVLASRQNREQDQYNQSMRARAPAY